MRSSACLFRGIPNTMKAYDSMDIPAWSLANGKDLIFSYNGDSQTEGRSMLMQGLQMLEDNESQAILTLRVYDEHPANQKITNKTEWTNSFTFALFDPEDGMVHQPRGKSALLARISALEEQISGNDDNKDEKPRGIQGMIGSLLERPDIQERLIQTVTGIVSNIFGQQKPIAAMAGIPQGQPQAQQQEGSAYDALPADQQDKIKMAMEVLMKRDPLLGDHLLKLAQMDPGRYKMALTFL